MKQTERWKPALLCLPNAIALLAALFMLCALPLVFNDQFFDINRIKVLWVLRVVPVLGVAMLAALFVRWVACKALCRINRDVWAVLLAQWGFIIACVIACAMTGFTQETLTGSEGRYCGLYFLLCCAVAYTVIVLGDLHGQVISLLAGVVACVCSILGVLNVLGVDPLGFYVGIQKSQRALFVSTIGNVDFFGAYLSLLFPLCVGQAVFQKNRWLRWLFGVFSVCCALGIAASRSDCAFAAMQLSCLALLALSGDRFEHMFRIFVLWALCFLALPVVEALLPFSLFQIRLSGVMLLLCRLHIPQAGAALCAAGALACRVLARWDCAAPGRNRLLRIVLTFCLLVVLFMLSAIYYFTFVDFQSDLGTAETLLRFNDEWGTRRGFVYRRALRAFADYTPVQKLLGRGLDLTERILTPYFDNPKMLAYGVFNDAHNQVLQFLLTSGLLGACAVVAFHLLSLRAFFKRAGQDPILCGAFASLFGYTLTAMLSVTQPILLAVYVSISALGASRLCHVLNRGESLES